MHDPRRGSPTPPGASLCCQTPMVLIAAGHAANFNIGAWRCLECEAHELTNIRTDGQTYWVGAMGRAIKRDTSLCPWLLFRSAARLPVLPQSGLSLTFPPLLTSPSAPSTDRAGRKASAQIDRDQDLPRHLWKRSWTTSASCGATEKVVDEWLQGGMPNALLAEAGVAERKVRATTREAVEPASVQAIQCVECGEIAQGAALGWKAYLGGGFEGLPLEVAAFCPACAAREFGDG